ncbi:hypothetical protein MMC25_003732 [Agyrium rufum]|nr:hypothetical protein [Agyrium rufum]
MAAVTEVMTTFRGDVLEQSTPIKKDPYVAKTSNKPSASSCLPSRPRSEALEEALRMSEALQSPGLDGSEVESRTFSLRNGMVPEFISTFPVPPRVTTPNTIPFPNFVQQPRHAACTHLTLGRVYNTSYHCVHCKRKSCTGWLYSCTQDLPTNGHESIFETIFDANHAEFTYLQSEVSKLAGLSAWTQKAIEAGEYTPEQIDILTKQKQQVNEAVLFPNTVPSLTLSKADQGLETLKTDQLLTDRACMALYLMPRMKPDCFYRTCPACRPISRDRSWNCIDHVYGSPDPVVIDFANENRPVSDARILRAIGNRSPTKPAYLGTAKCLPSLPPTPRRIIESSTTSESSLITTESESEASLSTTDSKPEGTRLIKDKGFRKSFTRAVRYAGLRHAPWHTPRRRLDELITKHREEEEQGEQIESLSTRYQGQREMDTIDGGDMGTVSNVLRRQAADELMHLVHATTVPLPHEDGKNRLDEGESGEVIVDDGIAVTEEAVTTGEADIIMHI